MDTLLNILAAGKEGEFGHVFTSYRVLVENTIEKIKNWQICRNQLRFFVDHGELGEDDILLMHHQCWMIASSFVNQRCS